MLCIHAESFVEIEQGKRPCGAFIFQNFVKFSVLGGLRAHPCTNFGKFCQHRCNELPLPGEKPDLGAPSNCNTGSKQHKTLSCNPSIEYSIHRILKNNPSSYSRSIPSASPNRRYIDLERIYLFSSDSRIVGGA